MIYIKLMLYKHEIIKKNMVIKEKTEYNIYKLYILRSFYNAIFS